MPNDWRRDFPLLDDLSIVGSWTLSGIVDASQWISVISIVYKSRKIQSAVTKVALLNGVVLLGSLLIFENLLLPSARHVLGSNVERGAWVSESALSRTFHVLWSYPIYALSLFLSSAWYQQIGDGTVEAQGGKTRHRPERTFDGKMENFSSGIYKNLLLLLHLQLCALLYALLPYSTGAVVGLVYFSWATAMYSFEYRWAHLGWDFDRRMHFMEEKWAYFFGFGLPCSVATFYLPQLMGAALFALLFPAFIIMANTARPIPVSGLPMNQTSDPDISANRSNPSVKEKMERRPNAFRALAMLPNRFPIFQIPNYVAYLILRGVSKRHRL